MDGAELAGLLAVLRRVGGEPSDVEVKTAASGLPRSVLETLVAFANTAGGTVVLGVDERTGFQVVGLAEAAKQRGDLDSLASDAITPSLRLDPEILEIEGGLVVVAEVPPSPADQRPVFVTSKGVNGGSYLRVGDGDRRMNDAEIALTIGGRTQPRYDAEPVEGSSGDDLDRSALARTLERVRRGAQSLRGIEDTTALHRMQVLSAPSWEAPATLAGLLAFGVYPQQLFPQLIVSVIVRPAADGSPGTARFLDNVTARGSIPEMVSEVVATVRRNLSARSTVTGDGRVEQFDYPLEAIREAVVNAVLHRDYSPVTRGTQVQVELLPDRLEVRSPGGLHGPVTEDDLGVEGVSSSRNAVLASLLSDTYLPQSDRLVAENRASGIPAMIEGARRQGLPRPVFTSSVSSFVVTMSRSELLGLDTRQWLASLERTMPSTIHEVALAMMRTGFVTNAALREWGAEPMTATRVLRELVDWNLALKQGGRRYARYVLDPSLGHQMKLSTQHESARPRSHRDVIRDLLRRDGDASAANLETESGLSRVSVLKYVNQLVKEGLVEAVGGANSPRRVYRWIR